MLSGIFLPAPAPALADASNRTNTSKIKLAITESSLGRVPTLALYEKTAISADFLHVAYPVVRGGQWTVCLDGVDGPRIRCSVPTAGT